MHCGIWTPSFIETNYKSGPIIVKSFVPLLVACTRKNSEDGTCNEQDEEGRSSFFALQNKTSHHHPRFSVPLCIRMLTRDMIPIRHLISGPYVLQVSSLLSKFFSVIHANSLSVYFCGPFLVLIRYTHHARLCTSRTLPRPSLVGGPNSVAFVHRPFPESP